MRLKVRLWEAWLIFKQDRLSSIISLIGIIVGVACLGCLLELQQIATWNYQHAAKLIGEHQAHITLLPMRDKSPALMDTNKWTFFTQAQPQWQLVPFSQYQFESNKVMGVPPEAYQIWPLQIQSGRWLNVLDAFSRVAVVGINHPSAQDKTLIISGDVFTVIGVFEAQAMPLLEVDLNQAVLIHWAMPKALGWGASIDMVWMEGDSEAFKGYFELYFPGYHFFIRDSRYYLQNFAKQVKTFEHLLSKIGIITLFLGGMSLFNLRLMSFQKRQSEIGIRLTLGARPLDIASLFLLETVYLGIAGGLIGIVISKLISWSVALHLNWDYHISLSAGILALVSSIGLSTVAGLYPSIQAARLKPSFLLTSH